MDAVATVLTVTVNDDPTANGSFVSEYIGYHVAWYQDWSQNGAGYPPEQQCLMAGHVHVGRQVSAADATAAVEKQLDALIAQLPTP